MSVPVRLDKLLSDAGYSRREAKGLIRQGRVRMGGAPLTRAEEKIDPEKTLVTVDGQPVLWRQYHYILLYKPAGVVTAVRDAHQPTVLELLPTEVQRLGLFPVGRLDKDTRGLLLLTDHGELAHRLLSPARHVEKNYLAEIDGRVDETDIAAFAGGLTLADGTVCLPALLEDLGPGRCRVTLREGKYHQVRRMLAARGKPVTALLRTSFGPLALDEGLEPGDWRWLSETEETAVRALLT